MLVKVTDIWYDIEPEDICDLDEEDFALRSDYIRACENVIDEILEDLPSEMLLEVEDGLSEGEIEDDLLDTICDETGWLVRSFNYEIVE